MPDLSNIKGKVDNQKVPLVNLESYRLRSDAGLGDKFKFILGLFEPARLVKIRMWLSRRILVCGLDKLLMKLNYIVSAKLYFLSFSGYEIDI